MSASSSVGSSTWAMSLADFFQKYAPASFSQDAVWSEAIAGILASPADKEVVDLLRTELQRDGKFAEPIRVHEDGADSTVANGMHRLVALHLENASEVEVTTGSTIGDCPVIEVEFRVARFDGQPLSEEDHDSVYEWLRSFRIGDVWVSTDGMGTCNGIMNGNWYCPLDMIDDLTKALTERALTRIGLDLQVVKAAHNPNYGILTEEEEAFFQRILAESDEDSTSSSPE